MSAVAKFYGWTFSEIRALTMAEYHAAYGFMVEVSKNG